MGNQAGKNLTIRQKLVLSLKSVLLEGDSDFTVATEQVIPEVQHPHSHLVPTLGVLVVMDKKPFFRS